MDLKIEQGIEEKWRKGRKVRDLLICLLSACSSWGWARLKQGAQNTQRILICKYGKSQYQIVKGVIACNHRDEGKQNVVQLFLYFFKSLRLAHDAEISPFL